jgi:hypothetical protein
MTKSLMIYERAGEKLVEAYHLALFLGYEQQSSLRKQVLLDWPHLFKEGVDYWLVYEEMVLRRYEATHKERGFGTLRPMNPARGRLFFTAAGIQRILRHTSKDIEVLLEELRQAGLLEAPSTSSRHPSLEFLELEELQLEASSSSTDQVPPGVHDDPGNRSPGLEQRKWEYSVLERLLEHLEVITLPHLQKLAITSAEVALGRELEELRAGLESSRAHAGFAALMGGRMRDPAPVVDPAPPVSTSLSSPPEFFPTTLDAFYTLSQIGAKAGGYSARAAGLAANLVAARRGFSPSTIRTEHLSFNRIYERPDASGTMRAMYNFAAEFANEVIVELQTNPQFEPQPLSSPPDLSAEFGRTDRRYPILSRGPFEDEEQPASS